MVEERAAHQLVADARVGRLATVTPQGHAHVVPCCFALDGECVYSAVDAKPKSTLSLARLANLGANPRAALLVDHYEEDWDELWWVRVDGTGRTARSAAERHHALELLVAKYERYRGTPPPGPVIALDIDRWSWWSAAT